MSPIPFNPELPAVQDSLRRAELEARSHYHFGNIYSPKTGIHENGFSYPEPGEQQTEQLLQEEPLPIAQTDQQRIES